MLYGMPTLIENGTLEENAALCRELGLSFVELNMNFPEYQVHRLARTEELIRCAEKTGVFYTIHLDERLDPADFNPLVRKAYLETVRRAVCTAKELMPLKEAAGDARPFIINMHMNGGVYITLPDRKVRMYERDFKTYMQAFREFRIAAEESISGENILIAIENTGGFLPFERDAVGYLLESTCFGLTWDIGHSKAAGEGDVPFLMHHGERIVHFHIHDGTEEPPRDHLTLGDGNIDLPARLGFAEKCGARCVIETKTKAALKSSVQWLKENGLWQFPVAGIKSK